MASSATRSVAFTPSATFAPSLNVSRPPAAPAIVTQRTISNLGSPKPIVSTISPMRTTVTPKTFSTATPIAPKSTTNNVNNSGLTPDQQQLFGMLKNYLDEITKRGMAVNPNVNITPEHTASFMAQASREIDPYYANQLKISKDTFLKGLGYGVGEIQRLEQDAERQYNANLKNLSEQAAETGFTLSGRRQFGEQQLAGETQRNIEERRRQFQFQTGQAAGEFAQRFGTANLPNTPVLPETPQIASGLPNFSRGPTNEQGQITPRTLPLYELSPDVYSGLKGTQEFESTAAKQSRAAQLESTFRQNQYLNNLRTLNL